MTRPYDRYRVTRLDGRTMPDGSPAYVVERKSGATMRWMRDSGYMSQADAEALARQGNDPLHVRGP